MLFSDTQNGREKPPDATKKHKSDQSTALISYLHQMMTQIEILLLEKNLSSILLKGLLVKPNHFSGGRTKIGNNCSKLAMHSSYIII